MKTASNGLSEMTLGTVQLGLKYGIANQLGKPSHDTSSAMLLQASQCGINSLDTSQSYGDSEAVIGSFFRRYPQESRGMMVTTKVICQAADNAPEALVEQELTKKTEASLLALGQEQLRFLLLHHASDMLKAGGAVNRVMKKLVKQGYTQQAGVSVYTQDEIREMLKYPVYTAVQLPLSVLDQKLIDSGLLEEIKKRGISIFVRSVFSQGLIFLDTGSMTHPILREYAAGPLKQLQNRCIELNCTPGEYALSFVRRLSAVTSIVLGADTPQQIAQNAALFDKPAMDDDEFRHARTLFASVPFDRIMEALR